MSNIEKIKNHLSNSAEFTKHYFPSAIESRIQNVSSVPAAIKSGTGAISVLRKNHGADAIESKIELMVAELQKSFNLNQKLSPEQIKDTAREICLSFYILSVEEIAYVFRKARRGEYGPVKFALNQFDIIGWVSDYHESRITEFMQGNSADHGYNKHHKDDTPLNEHEIKLLSKFKVDLPGDREEEYQEFKKMGYPLELNDTSDNQELQEMKRKLAEEYGIEPK